MYGKMKIIYSIIIILCIFNSNYVWAIKKGRSFIFYYKTCMHNYYKGYITGSEYAIDHSIIHKHCNNRAIQLHYNFSKNIIPKPPKTAILPPTRNTN